MIVCQVMRISEDYDRWLGPSTSIDDLKAKRLGLGEPGPLRGATPSPLEATSHPRTPNLVPTSDRVPGAAILVGLYGQGSLAFTPGAAHAPKVTYRPRFAETRTPGFRPSVNSNPAASSTCRRLFTVRLRSFSPRSKRTTVSGDTLAAAANFLALRPIAALAIRHCTGSTGQNLCFRCRAPRCHSVITAAIRAPPPIISRISKTHWLPSILPCYLTAFKET